MKKQGSYYTLQTQLTLQTLSVKHGTTRTYIERN